MDGGVASLLYSALKLREYPNLNLDDEKDKALFIREVANIRKDDITQFQNIQNTFIAGRKVGRVPSSSIDVIDGDKVGDFNVTSTYAYFLIDNAGTGEWRRVAVSSW